MGCGPKLAGDGRSRRSACTPCLSGCGIIGRTRKGLASALPGSGPKLVEDADALVLQETLTRFGLNSHHQRDLEVGLNVGEVEWAVQADGRCEREKVFAGLVVQPVRGGA